MRGVVSLLMPATIQRVGAGNKDSEDLCIPGVADSIANLYLGGPFQSFCGSLVGISLLP